MRTIDKTLEARAIGTLTVALLVLGMAIVPAAAWAAGGGSDTSATPVDLNRASETELTEVPGIGPSLAKRIVDFRDENGAFKRVEDLLKVRGIGEKSFQKIRPHVTVGKSK